MKLSNNFSLCEFEDSQTAVRLGIDNKIPANLIPNVQKVANTLQKIRNDLGLPISISSGYRCPELNKAIGGATKSDHMTASAVDFNVKGMTPFEVCKYLEPKLDQLGIGQLIHEFGSWVHLSIVPNKQRTLTAFRKNGTTKYASGIFKL